MRKYRTLFLSLLILSHLSYSQQKTKIDTLKIDTLNKASKSEKIKDSIPAFTSIPNLDVLNSHYDSTQFVLKNEIQYSDYFNFSDIASHLKDFTVFDFGNPGQPNPLSFQGLDYRNINIFIDGIPVQNSFFGIPEQTLIMPEDISKIEIIPASESFLFGRGGAAKSINIITTKFNTSTPFTNLRHIEAPYETYLTDGIFSQNITRNSNIMIGFNYQTSTGRYNNSDYTFFNVRSRYRLNISNDLNLLISDYFYKNERGLNGGLIPYDTNNAPVDIYDERAAIAEYPNAREKILRNDLNLILGAKFFNDSLNLSRLNVSMVTENRKFINSMTLNGSRIFSIEIPITTFSMNIEARQDYRYLFNNISAYLGLNYLKIGEAPITRNIDASKKNEKIHYTNLWGAFYDDINYNNLLTVNLFARYNIYTGNNPLKKENDISFGLNSILNLSNLKPYFEFARYKRDINPSEEYELYSIDKLNEKHTYWAIGIKYTKKNFDLDLNLFYRKINNPIFYQLLTFLPDVIAMGYSYFHDQKINGANFKMSANFNKFDLDINANFFNSKLDEHEFLMFPGTFVTFGLYFQDTIATKNIGIKIGINGKFFSKYDGFLFFPDYYGLMPFVRDYSWPSVPSNGSINLLAVVKIQDAIIYLTLENIFNKNYYIVPYYPLNDRSFKLAVSWSFND